MIESRAVARFVVRGGLAAAAAALLLSPARAAADERERCFNAYEHAQRLRQGGKLCASREKLQVCAEASCPSFVRKDCSAWLGEVEASISGVVVTATGPKGKTESQLVVFIDGERLAEPIDGHTFPVDPGKHDVRYELDGRSVEGHVLVPEGDKAFPLFVDYRALAPPPGPSPVPPPAQTDAPPEAPPAPSRPSWLLRLPVGTYVSGGLAVAAVGLFAGFGLAGNAAESCAPSCTHSQISTIRTDYFIADLSLAAALAAGGAAVTFALTAPRSGATPDGAKQARAAAWWLGVRPGVGGGLVAAGSRF
jgi:hypothetical protein